MILKRNIILKLLMILATKVLNIDKTPFILILYFNIFYDISTFCNGYEANIGILIFVNKYNTDYTIINIEYFLFPRILKYLF